MSLTKMLYRDVVGRFVPALAGLFPVVLAAQIRAPASITAFVHVNVIPMDRERVMANQTVIVRNGRVTRLGPTARVSIPAGARRIDGRGKYLMPGLADMHTHLAYAGGWNPDIRLSDSATRDSLLTASAERELFVMLANGITTIRNMDFRLDVRNPLIGYPVLEGPGLMRLKRRAAASEILSPRIYTSSNWQLDSMKSIDENLRRYKTAGYDHLKPYYEQNPLLDSVIQAAHRHGVPVVGHAFEGQEGGYARNITAGFKSVEHLSPYWGFLRGDTNNLQGIVDAMARAGIWNSATTGVFGFNPPSTYPSRLELRYGMAEFALARGESSLRNKWGAFTDTMLVDTVLSDTIWVASWRRVVKRLYAAGPGILLGTDATTNTGPVGFLIHRALQFSVLMGLTPYQALETGTVNVAKYFGTEDSTGTIAVGKRADLVLLDSNPLENIRHTSDIAGVMIGGRWVSRAAIERRLMAFYRGRAAPFDVRAFIDVNVIPMDRERVLTHQTVVVREGQITAVGPVSQVKVPVNATRIPGRGKFLMPGLVDLHTHVVRRATESSTDADATLDAERRLFTFLAEGVTTVRNLDFRPGVTVAPNAWSPGLYASGDWRVTLGQSVEANLESYKQARRRGQMFAVVDPDSEPRAVLDSLVQIARDSGLPLVWHRPHDRIGEYLALKPDEPAATMTFKAAQPARTIHVALRAAVRAGVRPFAALRAGTVDALRVLQPSDSAGAGTVAVGRRANLLLLGANPLVDVRNARNIAGLMVDGRWLSRDDIEWRQRHYRIR